MALDPLATIADLTARGLTVAVDEEDPVAVYLQVASAAVREAAGVPISQTTSTVVVEGEPQQRLTLPGPPVTAVDEVSIDGVVVTDWRLRSDRLWRYGGWSVDGTPVEVEITYTHGLPTVPDDIVDLVCRIAATTLVAHRAKTDGSGIAAEDIRMERIGDYTVQYGDSGQITEMELPQHLREQLAGRFGGGVSVLRSR